MLLQSSSKMSHVTKIVTQLLLDRVEEGPAVIMAVSLVLVYPLRELK